MTQGWPLIDEKPQKASLCGMVLLTTYWLPEISHTWAPLSL